VWAPAAGSVGQAAPGSIPTPIPERFISWQRNRNSAVGRWAGGCWYPALEGAHRHSRPCHLGRWRHGHHRNRGPATA
jgi:hypothetical protein